MSRNLIYILSLFFTYSCQSGLDQKYNQQEINSWKVARLSNNPFDFEDYINVFPRSPKFDSAVYLYFHFRDSLWSVQPPPVGDCWSSCVLLKIKSDKTVLLGNKRLGYSEIRKVAFDTLSDHSVIEFPKFLAVTDPLEENRIYSNIRFHLTGEIIETEALKPVVLQLDSALFAYKNQLSQNWYNRNFEQIPKEYPVFLDSLLNKRIFLHELNFKN